MLFCGSSNFLKFFPEKKKSDLMLSGLSLSDNEECSTTKLELVISVVLHKVFGTALTQR